jgi:hypothetical protein
MTPRRLDPSIVQARLSIMRGLLDDLTEVDAAGEPPLAENRMLRHGIGVGEQVGRAIAIDLVGQLLSMVSAGEPGHRVHQVRQGGAPRRRGRTARRRPAARSCGQRHREQSARASLAHHLCTTRRSRTALSARRELDVTDVAPSGDVGEVEFTTPTDSSGNA